VIPDAVAVTFPAAVGSSPAQCSFACASESTIVVGTRCLYALALLLLFSVADLSASPPKLTALSFDVSGETPTFIASPDQPPRGFLIFVRKPFMAPLLDFWKSFLGGYRPSSSCRLSRISWSSLNLSCMSLGQHYRPYPNSVVFLR